MAHGRVCTWVDRFGLMGVAVVLVGVTALATFSGCFPSTGGTDAATSGSPGESTLNGSTRPTPAADEPDPSDGEDDGLPAEEAEEGPNTVDEAGGTVTYEGEAGAVQIRVPGGAVAAATDFSITPQEMPGQPPEGAVLVGGVAYQIDASAELQGEIEITLPIPGKVQDGAEYVIMWSEDGQVWNEVPTTVDAAAGTASATTTHVSWWGIFCFWCTDEPDCTENPNYQDWPGDGSGQVVYLDFGNDGLHSEDFFRAHNIVDSEGNLDPMVDEEFRLDRLAECSDIPGTISMTEKEAAAQILSNLEEIFAGYNICFHSSYHHVKPEWATFSTVFIGGWSVTQSGTLGKAERIDTGNQHKDDISVVSTTARRAYPPDLDDALWNISITVAHELGHTLGLVHILGAAIMGGSHDAEGRSTVQWEAGEITGGDWDGCEQDAPAILLRRLGPASGTCVREPRPEPEPIEDCSEGWVHNPQTGHCYALTSTGLTWHEAEAEAVALGGHLVTINDDAENQWLVDTFLPLVNPASQTVWIGFTDRDEEGRWTWVAGDGGSWRKGDSTGTSFTSWASGEPNNAPNPPPEDGEDYGECRLQHAGHWNDAPSGNAKQGIIERVGGDAAPGLVARWTFDDCAGDVAADASGNGLDGELFGGPAWASRGAGCALTFDGDDDYVYLGTSLLGGAQFDQFTLEATFASDDMSSAGQVAGTIFKNETTDGEFNVFIRCETNRLEATIYTANEGTLNLVGPVVTDSRPHHVALRKNAATATLYLDGAEVHSVAASGPLRVNGTWHVTIGAGLTTYPATQHYQGMIDDVAIYDYPRSDEQIEQAAAQALE